MSARPQKLWLHHDRPSFQHITFPRPKIMQIHNLSALNWWQLQNVSNCRQQKTSCLLKVVASCHAVVGDSTHSESLLLVICTNSYKNSITSQSFSMTFPYLYLLSISILLPTTICTGYSLSTITKDDDDDNDDLYQFSMTFQAWKVVLLNSMAFHHRRTPCFLSNAMHGQNINLPVCVCLCPSHFLSTRLQVRPLDGFLQLIV